MMFEDIPEKIRKKLAAAEISSWADLSELTKKEAKAIKGIGPKSFVEIEYHMVKDKIKFKAPPKKYKTSTDNRKKVILHFIKQKSKIRWPIEMKTADKLLSQYEIDFLLTINPKVEVYSLNYFLNPYVKQKLDARYSKWKCDDLGTKEGKEIKFEDEVVVEEVEVKKQKTLKDFLS